MSAKTENNLGDSVSCVHGTLKWGFPFLSYLFIYLAIFKIKVKLKHPLFSSVLPNPCVCLPEGKVDGGGERG